MRDIGNLISETPIQHDYEAGVEVRSLLSTERLEDMDGRLAVTDVDFNGNRFVKFWVDETPISPREERTTPPGDENLSPRVPHVYSAAPPFPNLTMGNGERAQTLPERRERPPQDHIGQGRGKGPGSPRFGGGAYFDEEEHEMGHTLERRTRNIGPRRQHTHWGNLLSIKTGTLAHKPACVCPKTTYETFALQLTSF